MASYSFPPELAANLGSKKIVKLPVPDRAARE
jgi:hypothetical protein